MPDSLTIVLPDTQKTLQNSLETCYQRKWMILASLSNPLIFRRSKVSETVNIHETDGRNLTEVLPDFRFENTRRDLIAMRVSVGAKTRKGHACSNLVEQMDALRTAEGFQRENLLKAIPYQMARLSAQ